MPARRIDEGLVQHGVGRAPPAPGVLSGGRPRWCNVAKVTTRAQGTQKGAAAAYPAVLAAMVMVACARSDADHALWAATPAPTVHALSFAPTTPNTVPPPPDVPAGMVWIPGGEFSMGAEDPRGTDDGGHEAMSDARPIHRVYVGPFWLDATEVTNEQFARFVKATGYLTVAERTPTREEFPEARPEALVPG